MVKSKFSKETGKKIILLFVNKYIFGGKLFILSPERTTSNIVLGINSAHLQSFIENIK